MADTPVAAPAPKKKRSISGDLTAKYGGEKTAAAQAQKDVLLQQQQSQQQSLSDLQSQQYDPDKSGMAKEEFDTQQRESISSAQNALSSTASGINTQQSIMANPMSQVDAKTRDIIAGSQFGETVLGEEGLGRAGEDKYVQQAMSGLSEQAKGFSGAESLARREQAVGNLNQVNQAQQRSLQAQLARAGVRGGQAGAQVRDTAIAGLQQRSNLERDLFLKGEEAARSGTQALATSAGHLAEFDLGQAAKEKNIVLQSGLGFAQLGAAERGAKLQADASKAAAASQAAASCHTGDAEVKMADGTYKRIDEIKVGEEVHLGGRVKMIGVGEADSHIYKIADEYVTSTHLIEFQGKFQTVVSLGFERTLLPTNTLIYPMATERGYYMTKSGVLHGDLFSEENSEGLSFSLDYQAKNR